MRSEAYLVKVEEEIRNFFVYLDGLRDGLKIAIGQKTLAQAMLENCPDFPEIKDPK